MHKPCGCIALLVLGAILFSTEISLAQTEPQAAADQFRESVSLDVNNAVLKKMGSVQDFLAGAQWEDAINSLIQISQEYGNTLYPESPGRYLRVATYCQNLLAGFPPEAIQIYREKVDPRARRWLEEAEAESSVGPLLQIVDQALMSSYGDDALYRLGEISWERGELGQARDYWRKLLPPEPGSAARSDTGLFYYPDSDLSVPPILARLILVSLFEGNFKQAEAELAVFRERYPDAEGSLAGKQGNLADQLTGILSDRGQVSLSHDQDEMQTFAGHQTRNFRAGHPLNIGAAAWSFRVPLVWSQEYTRKPAFGQRVPPGLFPVVHGEHVFINDSERIYALNWKTGTPAWSDADPQASPIIYPSVLQGAVRLPFRSVVGVPRFTMTVADGRLYARMGSPVTSVAKDERLGLFSELVCLDLDEGEGKMLWKISSAELREQNFVWSFEGAPVVAGDRFYVVLHRGFPEVQTNVACFSTETGEMLWNQKVCLALRNIEEGVNYITHLLLTLAEGQLYLSTDMGAIASLNTQDGKLNWVVTYPSADDVSRRELSDHMASGLVPCLYDQGILFVAPQDTKTLMAFDASSGLLLWEREWPEQIRNLLGVTARTLVVSGNQLYGIDRASGALRWKAGYLDPEGFGYGRGLLAGENVYWPLRDELLVVDIERGTLKQRIPLQALQGETGGNLVIAGDQLLIAQPRKVTAFQSHGIVPGSRKANENLSAAKTQAR